MAFKGMNVAEYKLSFTADTSKARKEIESLQQTLTDLISKNSSASGNLGITADIQKATSAAVDLKAQLTAATDVNTGKLDLSKFSQSLQASGKNLSEYQAQLSALGPAGQEAFAQLATSIASSDAKIKNSNSLIETFRKSLMNVATYQITTGVWTSLIGSLQSAYNYAQDLNKSLTDIQIVTNQSSEQMAEFAKQANKAAQSLSTTTTAYTDAALIFYQQGLSGKDVTDRTNVAIKMAQATGDAASDVSSYMTAIWNNFDDGSESLEHYADVITALGASTASSSSEIAEGLSKFASVAETTGLSYDYATAALATLVANTRQSADTVGNSLKTIFSRLESVSLGETLDDGVTLTKYSTALQKVGVDILDTSGEMKDLDDILDSLASKWDNLTNAQKNALAQTVGGTRQYTQLIALMDNWDDMQTNLATAQSAEGTLDQQAETYAESWEAAQKRVQAAAEAIYSSLIDDKFFITMTDGVAEVLKVVNELITGFGGVKGILATLAPLFLQIFSNQIAASINNIGASIKDIGVSFNNIGVKIKDFTGGKLFSGLTKQNTSAESVRAEAIKSLSNMTNDGSQTGKIISDTYATQASNQERLLSLSDKISAVDKARLQGLMDICAQQEKEVRQSAELLKNAQDEAETQQILLLKRTSDNTTKANLQSQLGTYQQTSTAATIAETMGGSSSFGAMLYGGISGDQSQQLESLRTYVKNLTESFNEAGGAEKVLGSEGKNAFEALTKVINDTNSSVEKISNAFTTFESSVNSTNDKAKSALRETIEEITGLKRAQDTLKNNVIDVGKQYVSFKKTAESIKNSNLSDTEIVKGYNEVENTIHNVVSATLEYNKALKNGNEEEAAQKLGILNSAQEEANQKMNKFIALANQKGISIEGLKNAMTSLTQKQEAQNLSEEKLAQKQKETDAALEKVANAYDLTTQELLKLLNAQKNAKTGQDELTSSFNKASQVVGSWGAGITKAASAITSISSLITNFTNLTQTWSKKGVTFTEVLSSLGSVAMSAGMAITSVLALINTIGLPIAAIIAGLTAIATIIVVVMNSLKSDTPETRLEEAKERTTEWKTELDETKTTVDNLKSAFDNYNSIQDTLKSLTAGTTEWKEALASANQNVLELIQTYPELAQYVKRDENGALYITDEGQDEYLALQQQRYIATQQAYGDAQADQREAQIAVDQNNFDKKFDNDELTGPWAHSLTDYISTVLGIDETSFITESSNSLEGGAWGIFQKVLTKSNFSQLSGLVGEELTAAIISLFSDAGYTINKEVAEELGTILRGSGADGLLSQFEALNDEIKTSAEQTRLYNETMANYIISANDLDVGYTGNFAGRVYENLYNLNKNINLTNANSENSTDRNLFQAEAESALIKQFGSSINVNGAEAGWQSDGSFKFYKWDSSTGAYSTELSSYTEEEMASILATTQTLDNFTTSIEASEAMMIRLKNSGNDVSQAAYDYLSNGDFSNMSANQRHAIADTFFNLEAFNDDGTTNADYVEALESIFGDNNGEFTQAELNALGYDTVEAFINAFQQGLADFDLGEKDFATKLSETTNYFQSQWESLILNLNEGVNFDSIGQSTKSKFLTWFNSIFAEFGNEGTSYVSSVLSKITDSGQLATTMNLLSSITDFSTLTVNGLKAQLEAAGVDVNKLADDDLLNLINICKQASVTVEDLTTKYANQKKIVDGLTNGETISAEDYETLGDGYSQYFTKMMDGTYKLIGFAEQLQEAVSNNAVTEFALSARNSAEEASRLSTLDTDDIKTKGTVISKDVWDSDKIETFINQQSYLANNENAGGIGRASDGSYYSYSHDDSVQVSNMIDIMSQLGTSIIGVDEGTMQSWVNDFANGKLTAEELTEIFNHWSQLDFNNIGETIQIAMEDASADVDVINKQIVSSATSIDDLESRLQTIETKEGYSEDSDKIASLRAEGYVALASAYDSCQDELEEYNAVVALGESEETALRMSGLEAAVAAEEAAAKYGYTAEQVQAYADAYKAATGTIISADEAGKMMQSAAAVDTLTDSYSTLIDLANKPITAFSASDWSSITSLETTFEQLLGVEDLTTDQTIDLIEAFGQGKSAFINAANSIEGFNGDAEELYDQITLVNEATTKGIEGADDLNKAYTSGKITAEEYKSGLETIISNDTKATTWSKIIAINDAMASGILTATEYANELETAINITGRSNQTELQNWWDTYNKIEGDITEGEKIITEAERKAAVRAKISSTISSSTTLTDAEKRVEYDKLIKATSAGEEKNTYLQEEAKVISTSSDLKDSEKFEQINNLWKQDTYHASNAKIYRDLMVDIVKNSTELLTIDAKIEKLNEIFPTNNAQDYYQAIADIISADTKSTTYEKINLLNEKIGQSENAAVLYKSTIESILSDSSHGTTDQLEAMNLALQNGLITGVQYGELLSKISDSSLSLSDKVKNIKDDLIGQNEIDALQALVNSLTSTSFSSLDELKIFREQLSGTGISINQSILKDIYMNLAANISSLEDLNDLYTESNGATDVYQQGLETLAAKYSSCEDELQAYYQALYNGTPAEQQEAMAALEQAIALEELATEYGLTTAQIEAYANAQNMSYENAAKALIKQKSLLDFSKNRDNYLDLTTQSYAQIMSGDSLSTLQSIMKDFQILFDNENIDENQTLKLIEAYKKGDKYFRDYARSIGILPSKAESVWRQLKRTDPNIYFKDGEILISKLNRSLDMAYISAEQYSSILSELLGKSDMTTEKGIEALNKALEKGKITAVEYRTYADQLFNNVVGGTEAQLAAVDKIYNTSLTDANGNQVYTEADRTDKKVSLIQSATDMSDQQKYNKYNILAAGAAGDKDQLYTIRQAQFSTLQNSGLEGNEILEAAESWQIEGSISIYQFSQALDYAVEKGADFNEVIGKLPDLVESESMTTAEAAATILDLAENSKEFASDEERTNAVVKAFTQLLEAGVDGIWSEAAEVISLILNNDSYSTSTKIKELNTLLAAGLDDAKEYGSAIAQLVNSDSNFTAKEGMQEVISNQDKIRQNAGGSDDDGWEAYKNAQVTAFEGISASSYADAQELFDTYDLMDENAQAAVNLSSKVESVITASKTLEALDKNLSQIDSRGEKYSYDTVSSALITMAGSYDNCSSYATRYQEAIEKGTQADIDAAEAALRHQIAIGEVANEYNVNADELNTYYNYLLETKKITEDSGEAGVKYTAILMKQSQAFEKINKNAATYMKTIKNSAKGSSDWIEAITNMKDLYQDAFDLSDTDMDALGVAFFENAENAALLEKAAKGDKDAFEELQQTILNTLRGSYQLDIHVNDTEVLDKVFNLVSKLDEIPNIEIGASLDETEFGAALSQLTFDTQEAAENMNETLNDFGVTAKVVKHTAVVPETDVQRTTSGEISIPYVKEDGTIGYTTATATGVIDESTGEREYAYYTIEGSEYNGRGVYSGGSKDESSSGGGGRRSSAKRAVRYDTTREKRVEDEAERYHRVSAELSTISNNLSMISKLKDKAFGKDKLKAIQKETEALKQQKEEQEEYQKEIEAYYESDLKAAQDVGLQMDEEGHITNYESIMQQWTQEYNDAYAESVKAQNEAIDWWNSLSEDQQSDDTYKDIYTQKEEAAKAIETIASTEYDTRKSILDQYEDTLEKKEKNAEELLETAQEIVDNAIEEVQLSAELKIDVSDNTIKALQFQLDSLIPDNASGAADAIAAIGKQALSSQNKITALKDEIANFLTNENLQNLGEDFAERFINNTLTTEDWDKLASLEFTEDEMSTLTEIRDNLQEEYQTLSQYRDDVLEKVSSAFDEFNEELEDNTKIIEHLQNVTQTYADVLDIVGTAVLDDSGELTKAMDQAMYNSQLNNTKMIGEQVQALDQMIAEYQDKLLNDTNLDDAERKVIEDQIETWQEERDSTYETWLDSWKETCQDAADIFEDTLEQIVKDFEDTISGAASSISNLQDAYDKQKTLGDVYLDEYEQIYQLSKLTRDINNSIDETDNINAKKNLKKLTEEINNLQENGTKLSQYDVDVLTKKYEMELALDELEEARNSKTTVRMARDAEGNYGYVYTADETAVEEAEQNYEDKLHEMQVLNSDYIESMQEQILQAESDCSAALSELNASDYASYEEYQKAAADIQNYYSELIGDYYQQLNNSIDNNKDLYDNIWTPYSEQTGYLLGAAENYVDTFEETELSALTGYKSSVDAGIAFNEGLTQALNDSCAAWITWKDNIDAAMNSVNINGGDFATAAAEAAKILSDSSDSALTKAIEDSNNYVEEFSDILDSVKPVFTELNTALGNLAPAIVNMTNAIDKLYKIQSGEGSSESENDISTNSSSSGINTLETAISSGTTSSSSSSDTSSNITSNINSTTDSDNSKAAMDFTELVEDTTDDIQSKFVAIYNWAASNYSNLQNDVAEEQNQNSSSSNFLENIAINVQNISNILDLNAAAAETYSNQLTSIGNELDKINNTLEQQVNITAEFKDATSAEAITTAFQNLINRASQYANQKE